MQERKITRLVEWDLIPLNNKYNPSIFDYLGSQALMVLFFDLEDTSSVNKAKSICLKNPLLKVVGILPTSNLISSDQTILHKTIATLNFNFPVFLDSENKTKERYQVSRLPYWILSDKAGNIITRKEGSSFQNMKLLENDILNISYIA